MRSLRSWWRRRRGLDAPDSRPDDASVDEADDADIEKPEDPGVPSALASGDLVTASVLSVLLTDFPSWVRRRVEYVDFVDDISVARRVSIDFAVPQAADAEKIDEKLLPAVPLTFLLKGEVLKNFDLRDAQDNPVPMLTKRENGTLAGNVLIHLAEEALEKPLTGELAPLVPRLRTVAEEPQHKATAEVDSWEVEAKAEAVPYSAALDVLTNRVGFMDCAYTLAENYVLFAVGPPEPNTRRLMKFGYEEPFKLGDDPEAPEDKALSVWERWRERFGWRFKTVNLAMPAVNLAASFHLEVPAPPDMEVQFARLVFKPRKNAVTEDDIPEPPSDVLEGPLVQRVHLYKADVDPSHVADAVILLRARRPGFLRAAVLTGWLVFVLLAVGAYYLDDVAASDNSQTAAALLLLGPTLLAGSLIRPGEHRMAASVLVGVRALLAVEIAATVLAVGLLAGAAAYYRSELWRVATVVAGLAAIGLLASYVLPLLAKGEDE